MQHHIAQKEIDRIGNCGVDIRAVEINGQTYVVAGELGAPAPPWDRKCYDIMVAIPAVQAGGLDAFYLRLPYTFQGGAHPRVNGAEITFDGSVWKLVSWHYPDGRPWQTDRDSLDTHIAHCKGFFWQRGAVNALK